jgi:hypothetical protein
MYTLKSLVKDELSMIGIDKDALLRILKTVELSGLNIVFSNIELDDKDEQHIDNIEVYDDNMNFLGQPMYESVYNYNFGFNVMEVHFKEHVKRFVPIVCYIAATSKKLTVANITYMLTELDNDRQRREFIQCLKLNKNIREEKTKLFIKLL